MTYSRTLIVAEAGVNHNGSLARALEMIDVAAQAGADIIKFQTFDAASLTTVDAPKAAYQLQTTSVEQTQQQMLKALELSRDDHRILSDRAARVGIEFLSTPFDEDALHFLHRDLGVKRLKIGSGDLTHAPLLIAAARTKLPLLLSTGMATLEDIDLALAVVQWADTHPVGEPTSSRVFESARLSDALAQRITLLHCTSAYPCPVADVHLRAMGVLRERYALPVGYSDHTQGIGISVAAVAVGAAVIEKHFTLDRELAGPDHRASLNPQELASLVASIRDVESALGDATKAPAVSEMQTRQVARRSVVAARSIRAGEVWAREDLVCKRPATGLSPVRLWDLVGTTALRDYAVDECLDLPA